MILSPRLRKVSEQAVPGIPAADIGTDHARLPVFLVENAIVPYALASDIRPGPIESAERTIALSTVGEQIKTALAPGLAAADPSLYPQCFICGMGGLMIREILKENEERARRYKRLILQPQGHLEELRTWLAEHAFMIEKETCAKEGKRFYPIFCVRFQEDLLPRKIDREETFLGDLAVWERDGITLSYFLMLREKLQGILSRLKAGLTEDRKTREEQIIIDLNLLDKRIMDLIQKT